MAPDSLQIDQTIRKLLEEGRGTFQQFSTASSNVSMPSQHFVPSSSSAAAATSAFYSFLPKLQFASLSEAFAYYWQSVCMPSILLIFLLSCITQFAQYYQLILDREESQKLRERIPHQIMDDIKSPCGRLKLPPPTPTKKRKNSIPKNPSVESPVLSESSQESMFQQISNILSCDYTMEQYARLLCTGLTTVLPTSPDSVWVPEQFEQSVDNFQVSYSKCCVELVKTA
jgi:hypothetical protein